ncbi:hypothetical protein [Rummeliibacillus stabekisii]|uniref:hypothetical protein n=1 Tax=Rummeliibacillus stabekisii TaxID=241244 RepID=UPI003710ACFD
MSLSYTDISKLLKESFPPGTVQFTSSKKPYIPVQAYINRLENVAGEQWSWRVIGEPNIIENEQAIVIKGELTILNATRTGLGFSYYSKAENKNNKSVSAFKNAVNAAESDAIRSACDKFMMGWADLAPYRDWGANAGIDIPVTKYKTEENTAATSEKRNCSKCGNVLTAEDDLFLEVNNINLAFCIEHIPKHFLKNK